MTLARLTNHRVIFRLFSKLFVKNIRNAQVLCSKSDTVLMSEFHNLSISFSRSVFTNHSKLVGGYGPENRQGKAAAVAALAFIGGIAGSIVYINSKKNRHHAADIVEAGLPIAGLPNYTSDQVKRHNTENDRVWMTYKNGVYDVTEYIGDHPGGLSIMLSAGESLEPFFSTYDLHYHNFVLKKLETFRIGNIYDDIGEVNTKNIFSNEPERNTECRPHTTKPFNIEYQLSRLNENFLTPNDKFFIRNHFPVPNISGQEYRLLVCTGDAFKPLTLSLDQLKNRFPKKTVVSTLQCVENRRKEMSNAKRLYGIKWGYGAIGNAKWTGACLDDILTYAGIDLEKDPVSHIHFEGFDTDPSGTSYCASVPVELIKKFKRDIILAYEMNDEELSRDHGYPIRVVLPGFSGARQVKWLKRIRLMKNETRYHWQNHYKPFLPTVTWNDAKFNMLPAIQDMPVQAALCEPMNAYEVKDGEKELQVSGYAWSGGGRGILSVEISTDGGKTWKAADLQKPRQKYGEIFAWTLWNTVIEIPEHTTGGIEIICRAIDSSLNGQPHSVEEIWNFCGVLNNSWHRITVHPPNKEGVL